MKELFPRITHLVPQPKPEDRCEITICCDNGILECVGGDILIFHCPDHMTLCIRDGEVLSAQTNGIRQ